MEAERQDVPAGLRVESDPRVGGSQGSVHLSGQIKDASSETATSYVGPPPRVPARQHVESRVEYNLQSVGEGEWVPVGAGVNTPGVGTEGVYEKAPVGDPNSGSIGSGARYNADKTPFKYVPLHLLRNTARVFEQATRRPVRPYPVWNWAKGMQWSVPYECLLRHLEAWYRGEELDPDSGLPHLAHAMCNLLMLEHYATAYKEGDDRPDAFKV